MSETDKPIPDSQENVINQCWYKQIKNGIMIKIIQTKHEMVGLLIQPYLNIGFSLLNAC